MAAEQEEKQQQREMPQPAWHMPSPMQNGLLGFWDQFYPLRMMNSLTRTKTPFVPMKGNKVLWYMCGPTVYDASHMGHARTYLGFDVVRRIMESYFNYEVCLCMNITDIDDKIIIRSKERGVPFMDWARQNEASYMEDMAQLNVKPPDVLVRVTEYVPEIVIYIEEIIAKGFAYESNGSVYFDTKAFREASGHDYPKLLPEGAANAELLAEGEGKLHEESKGKDDKRNPTDFALWKRTKEPVEGEERDPFWESPWGDGRPGWHIECSVMCSSTLGRFAGYDGRIDIHSGGIDLRFPHHDNEMAQSEAHYHGNCSWDHNQWVNYFVHSGHLNIKGFKMSKSLKNFITIQGALQQNTARQIRLLFLLHKYNAPMDYGDSTMTHAMDKERVFREYFDNVKDELRRDASFSNPQHWDDDERRLGDLLAEKRSAVHAALCDDFDTPTVIKHLMDLVRANNVYIEQKQKAGKTPVTLLLRSCAEFVTRIFRVFGLVEGEVDIGFDSGLTLDGAGGGDDQRLHSLLDTLTGFRERVRTAARTGDTAAVLAACEDVRDDSLPEVPAQRLPTVLEATRAFRERVKEAAGAGDTRTVLAACDDVRDDILPAAGVRLEDLDGRGRWKLDTPENLRRERELKEAEAEAKKREKAEKEAARAAKAAEEAKSAEINPRDMFRDRKTDDGKPLYTRFDDDGLPTHGNTEAGDDEPLKKSALKKLKKEQAKQAKLHAKHQQNK